MAGSFVVMLACRQSGLQIKGRDLELRGCDSALHHPPMRYAAIAFITKTGKANAHPLQDSILSKRKSIIMDYANTKWAIHPAVLRTPKSSILNNFRRDQ